MAGKTFQDRELAASVRILALNEIEKVLKQKKMDDFKKAVLLRLAGTVLPRLNEVSGADGEPLTINILTYGDDDPIKLHSKKLPRSVPQQ